MTMSNFTPPDFAGPGDKVMFLNEHGYDAQREQAAKIFEVGQVLTVESVDIGSYSSTYRFKGHKNSYNTVMFERLY